MYLLYILKFKNGILYTVITTDVARRFNEHKNGKGGHYTRSTGVKKIIYTEKYPDKSSALKREAQIKSWRRDKKLTLINNHTA